MTREHDCCANCVSRRQFLAAAAAAAALTACGDGELSGIGTVIPPVTPGGSPPITVVVSSLPGLATTGTLVQLPNAFVAAKRTGAATFDAFHMRCTHAGCLTDLANNQFDCPCHGSQFNVNGDVIRGPASDPLTKKVTSYNAATDVLTIT